MIKALTTRGIRAHLVLLATLLGVGGAVPERAIPGAFSCASHSLPREDASKARAAARSALPRSSQPSVSWACWNPDRAHAGIETRRTETPDGVTYWWEIVCSRERSWTCDPPEFHQRIVLSVPIGSGARAVQLDFEKDITLEKARALASQAVALYLDRSVPLRACAGKEVTDRRELPTGKPIQVSVSREDGVESAYLTDAFLSMSSSGTADDAGEMVPCWEEWVVLS